MVYAEICMCAYVYARIYRHTHTPSMSASVWAMRIVETVVQTSTTSYKLIAVLKAHCNIKCAYDALPIES